MWDLTKLTGGHRGLDDADLVRGVAARGFGGQGEHGEEEGEKLGGEDQLGDEQPD